MVGLFAAPQRFVPYVFIPWIRMELSDSKRPIIKTRHDSTEVRSATRFHLYRLPRDRVSLRVAEDARRRRLATGPDHVASGYANRTCGVCIRKRDSPLHQAIDVWRVDMRVTERSDCIESLLIGHNE